MPTKHKMAGVEQLARKICDESRATEDALEWCARMLRLMDGKIPGELVGLGEIEMKRLGAEVGRTYLKHHGGEGLDDVRTSSSRRCGQSCVAFLEGLGASSTHSSACKNIDDTLLRPYKTCHKLREVRDKFDPQLDERVVQSALDYFSAMTGLNRETLAVDDVMASYFGCQTEVSLNGGHYSSAFSCQALTHEAMIALDKYEDEENFLLRGYGRHEVTREIAAPILKQVTLKMESARRELEEGGLATTRSSPVVDAFFTHDSLVLPFAALLGLFDLGSIAIDSGASRMCPFASRVVVELTSCGEIKVIYNGAVVRSFISLQGWLETYAQPLSLDLGGSCTVHPGVDLPISHDEL